MSGGALKRVKEYSLSDGDIRKVLGDDVKIYTYPQLQTLRSTKELFDTKGRCILLFPTDSPTSGHWCCLLRKKKGIEFFDPYGDSPEEVKDNIPKSRMEALDIDSPYLTRLLRSLGLPVYYNTYAFQRTSRDVNTCGRHCIVRLLYGNLSLEDYKKVIDSSGLSSDDFVAGVTGHLLGK